MTHTERQTFLKTSRLGEVFGVSHLLPEVEATEIENIPASEEKEINLLSVDENSFYREVLESSIPVLVVFSAPWNGLGRIIMPLLLQFKVQCSEQIKLVEVNADENLKLSNTYRLKSVPTLLLIENGVVRERLDSFRGRDDLLLALEQIKTKYTNDSKNYKNVREAAS